MRTLWKRAVLTAFTVAAGLVWVSQASWFEAQAAPAILYVDEIRVQGSLVSLDIGPEEIDRVEVIKGAAAETLYGAEAAGGIIQIFTKDWVAENEPDAVQQVDHDNHRQ